MFYNKILNSFSLVIFLGMFSFLFAENKNISDNYFIEPEIQYYFETTVGYKKYEKTNKNFKNSPISVPLNLKSVVINNSLYNVNSLTKDCTPKSKIDYSNIPLYYDLKLINMTGPIASYVIEPSKDFENNISKYYMIDIFVDKDKVKEFYDILLKEINFFMAGEQDIIQEGKNVKIIFGWIDSSDIYKLSKSKIVIGYSFSRRDYLKAPLKNIVLIVKAPTNRDLNSFYKAFIEKLKKIGFHEKFTENIPYTKNDRFSFIKVSGMLPIDKIDLLITSPFIFKVSSHI